MFQISKKSHHFKKHKNLLHFPFIFFFIDRSNKIFNSFYVFTHTNFLALKSTNNYHTKMGDNIGGAFSSAEIVPSVLPQAPQQTLNVSFLKTRSFVVQWFTCLAINTRQILCFLFLLLQKHKKIFKARFLTLNFPIYIISLKLKNPSITQQNLQVTFEGIRVTPGQELQIRNLKNAPRVTLQVDPESTFSLIMIGLFF